MRAATMKGWASMQGGRRPGGLGIGTWRVRWWRESHSSGDDSYGNGGTRACGGAGGKCIHLDVIRARGGGGGGRGGGTGSCGDGDGSGGRSDGWSPPSIFLEQSLLREI